MRYENPRKNIGIRCLLLSACVVEKRRKMRHPPDKTWIKQFECLLQMKTYGVCCVSNDIAMTHFYTQGSIHTALYSSVSISIFIFISIFNLYLSYQSIVAIAEEMFVAFFFILLFCYLIQNE